MVLRVYKGALKRDYKSDWDYAERVRAQKLTRRRGRLSLFTELPTRFSETRIVPVAYSYN